MLPKALRLWAVLTLVLALHLAVAHSFHQLDTRQNDAGASIRPSPEPSEGASQNSNADFAAKTSSVTDGPRATGNPASKKPSSTDAISESTSSVSSSASPSPTASDDSGHPKFLNATIAEGELPLTPEITPGWGVAGVVMLLTGLTYALVGIKNRWIHTFFSTAYMAALGVAVLIVYIMSVPVSNAVQGGYVVAVVLSGCAVGAASVFFKELTEGLGCAIGGFCFSMWLMCLVPGGLLRSIPSKAVFISAFTLVSLGFYFSRWTRDWALILTIAFSGATITVLGLDCFTRAGLKEFWAYIWDVNSNLFPLGADTYPVTKGIRVQSAAIIIFLVGIISQIKLWRIVREKREKRAVDRAEGQRNLELEEESVGRHVEEINARERRQWERVYGQRLSGSGTDSHLSDVGDMGSEKKLGQHHAESYKLHPSEEISDMAGMSESDLSRTGFNPLMTAGEARDGKLTVRVGNDETPETPSDVGEALGEKVDAMIARQRASTSTKRLSQRTTESKRISQSHAVTAAPAVVPLPFHIPAHQDSSPDDDRSSIATFAADDVEQDTTHPRQAHAARRLSRGSLSLLQTMPQPVRDVPIRDSAASLEELVAPKTQRQLYDNESLVATIDGESDSGDGMRSVLSMEGRKSLEINAQLRHAADEDGDNVRGSLCTPSAALQNEARAGTGDKATAASHSTDGSSAERPNNDEGDDSAAVGLAGKAKSTMSNSSTPANLTKDRLPNSLSRVVMSYRTNEWAKHLSYADAPDLDEPRVAREAPLTVDKEQSVPVNMSELQKTAEQGTPEPAIVRSDSKASIVSHGPSVSRQASRRERPSMLARGRDSPPINQGVTTAAPFSNNHMRSISNPTHARRASAVLRPAVADPIPEEGIAVRRLSVSPSLSGHEMPNRSTPSLVPGVVSYNSPQTLIGQRDQFLRSRSHGNLLAGAQEPNDAASVYSLSMQMADPDSIPLSQRKHLMRQNSLMFQSQNNSSHIRMSSAGLDSNESLPFNSHQPKRMSTLPGQSVRDAQLASFRQSVQQDLAQGRQ